MGCVGIALALAPLGCAAPQPRGEPDGRGLVWIFPGIGAGAWCMGSVYHGLRDGGVDREIRINEWATPPFDFLGHLQNIESNRAQAGLAAEHILAYRDAHPNATIDLVGYSAGAGMAILAVEALPEDIHVRNIVLVQGALSPAYDLTPALRRIDGKLVNIYCRSDWVILGLGTETFGTVDRANVPSAGKEGFDLAAAVRDPPLCAKVVQAGWTRDMVWRGHVGGHLGILGRAWNRDYVAPWLTADANR